MKKVLALSGILTQASTSQNSSPPLPKLPPVLSGSHSASTVMHSPVSLLTSSYERNTTSVAHGGGVDVGVCCTSPLSHMYFKVGSDLHLLNLALLLYRGRLTEGKRFSQSYTSKPFPQESPPVSWFLRQCSFYYSDTSLMQMVIPCLLIQLLSISYQFCAWHCASVCLAV